MIQRRFGFDQPMGIHDVLAVMPTNGAAVSRKEIADALMRRKSPTLLAVLGEAVGRGLIAPALIPLPNKVDMFTYSLTEAGYEAYYGVRMETDQA